MSTAENLLTSSSADVVLNALPHPVIVVAADGKVTDANAAAEAFFEVSVSHLRRHLLRDLVPFGSPLLTLVEQVRARGAAVNEYKVDLGTPRNPGDRLVDLYVAPLPEQPDCVVVMLQERTIADKMDRQLTHRSAARSVIALAAMLAHEIKNPLSGIRGAAQLLEQSANDDDRTLTQLICDEADRIVKLVDRMEVFADERPIEREPINIHVVLDHVKRLAQSGVARHIKFVEDYDPSLPPVLANRDQLVQVFLNLVKNAAEAIGENTSGGEITLTTAFRPGVRLSLPGTKARISLPLEFCVKDNGPGVPDELMPHLFDPFVTTKPTGSGLGLALVAKIVGDHGGIIECELQPRRTIFRVLMPVYTGEGVSVGRRPSVTRGSLMPAGSILVADDDAAIRTVLNQALSRAGYEVRSTGNAATLWRWVSQGDGDLIITDVVLPDESAFDLLPRIKKARPDLPVLVMSAQNTFMTAIRASERGAYEYLPKPFDLKELISIVGRALSEPKEKARQPAKVEDFESIPLVGRSPAMQEIYRVLARLMQTDLTVMISGESGTGKELVARALHDYGKRRTGPFVAINMAAIPRDLIESELFGHEKGAFTGANTRSAGRFEQAEGGTLFLDEIGDMPMEAQTRLLRVLQQGEYTTVGGRTPIKADVRIIAATNKDLRQLIQQGLFREDLFFRLNVVPLRLPPLRERTEDIPDLIRHFFTHRRARRLAAEADRPGRARSAQAASLARQCARTGKSGAPARRALSARDHHLRRDRCRAVATDADGAQREQSHRRQSFGRGRALPHALFFRFRRRPAAARPLSPHPARGRLSSLEPGYFRSLTKNEPSLPCDDTI